MSSGEEQYTPHESDISEDTTPDLLVGEEHWDFIVMFYTVWI